MAAENGQHTADAGTAGHQPHALPATRSCPRCQGWLIDARDAYGASRSCLQCGYVDECCVGPLIADLTAAERMPHTRQRHPTHRNQPL